MKTEKNRVFLGYMRNAIGKIEIHPLEAPIVNIIYHAYLDGNSLGKISVLLREIGIPSPSGKPAWGKQIIDNLLSNEKYIGNDVYPPVVSRELFDEVQHEKARRSVKGNDTPVQTRYSNAHPLSGLLVCGECGRKCRRHTRSNGDVVWRCANRIEHGSEICKNSPAIPENELISAIAAALDHSGKLRNCSMFDHVVRDAVDNVIIEPNGQIRLELRQQKAHKRDTRQIGR